MEQAPAFVRLCRGAGARIQTGSLPKTALGSVTACHACPLAERIGLSSSFSGTLGRLQ